LLLNIFSNFAMLHKQQSPIVSENHSKKRWLD
jgi:hypothetical protein